jgi:predicted outer membrane repeat protein
MFETLSSNLRKWFFRKDKVEVRNRRSPLWVEVLEDRWAPAVLWVESRFDDDIGNTLRSVIDDANDGDEIRFRLGNGPVAINLDAQISTTKNITINGEDGQIWIDGGAQNRAFVFGFGAVGVSAYVKNLTFWNCSIEGGNGGAIEMFGKLTVENVTFWNCGAASGGAVYVTPTTADDNLSISNCTFRANSARGDGAFDWGGGAVCVETDGFAITMNVKNSVFIGNRALGDMGGAICVADTLASVSGQGTLVVNGCAFTNNTARQGGAIFASCPFFTVTADAGLSTFTGESSDNARWGN